MTVAKAAQVLGLSPSGLVKLERGERRLTDEYLRRASAAFNAPIESVMGSGAMPQLEQAPEDPEKLASLIALARERLGSLPEAEARNLLLVQRFW
jgi:transcriptional regulator with XRE-family HTH domain